MPGPVLCPDCSGQLPFIDMQRACARCGSPFGKTLCTECPMPGSKEALAHPEDAFPFSAARCALSFEGSARRIVRIYKDDDEMRLDVVIASLLCAAMRGRRIIEREEALVEHMRTHSHETKRKGQPPADWTQWTDALAYVPASPEAVLRRDFDHMRRVAFICSKWTGLPLSELLVSHRGVRDQRMLGRKERFANRRSSFELAAQAAKAPRRIVLIDDVFTTGATLSAATEVLLNCGVEEVRVVACCRVW